MRKVPANFHGKKGRSGRKTIREEVGEYRAAEALFFAEQDQETLEAKIRSGKFRVADRFILTAMEGDSRILAKAADKAIPNAGEEEKGTDFTINIVQFNAHDTNTLSVRPIKKALPARDSEESGEVQVADFT